MSWVWWLAGGVVVGLLMTIVLLAFFGPRLARYATALQLEKVKTAFQSQQSQLQDAYFQAASSTGKPRGLRWRDCEWEAHVEFVRDQNNGQFVAFVGITLHFEAVEGGDMEDVAAVGLPRNATAVFYFDGKAWQTSGATVMNKNPDEAVTHYGSQYERLGRLDN